VPIEIKKPIIPNTIYGHLAILKLCQIAGYDYYLGDAAKRTLIVLAGFSGTDGMCYPSISQIAKNLGVSRAAVHRQINILVKQNYLKAEGRYCPKTKRRKTNIFIFNTDLARQYSSYPEIFCESNVTSVVTFLVAVLYYMDCYPDMLQGHETSKSYTNKTDKIKQNKETNLNKTDDLLVGRKKLHAYAWEKQKSRQEESNVSDEMKNSFKDLDYELSSHFKF
jgi:DNA-binding Lrp family transcriptional regulator